MDDGWRARSSPVTFGAKFQTIVHVAPSLSNDFSNRYHIMMGRRKNDAPSAGCRYERATGDAIMPPKS